MWIVRHAGRVVVDPATESVANGAIVEGHVVNRTVHRARLVSTSESAELQVPLKVRSPLRMQ